MGICGHQRVWVRACFITAMELATIDVFVWERKRQPE